MSATSRAAGDARRGSPTRRPDDRRLRILRDLVADERGAAIVIFAIALVALFAFASFAIDIGRVLVMQRKLQAAADAASLAAVVELPDNKAAAASELSAYGAGPGGKNAIGGQNVASSAAFTCITSIGQTEPTCTSDPTKPNAVVVTNKTSVPLFFGGVIHWAAMSVSASSTALIGSAPPLDVMLVLDTTASMSNPCGAAVPGISNPSKLQCAKTGAQALLAQLRPGIDEAGLAIFPPIAPGHSVAPEFTTNCSSTWGITSSDLSYTPASTYVIAPLTNNFLESDGTLKPTSLLGEALNYNGGAANSNKGCGLESPGGVSTYFADAITFAQTKGLDADPANHLKAIVFLSDGEGNVAAHGDGSPCQSAIANAAAVKAQPPDGPGTVIYGVGYWENSQDASTWCGVSGNLSPYTGYQEVQAIASPQDFYAYFNGNSNTLTDIFTQIGQALESSARLVPDGTT